MKYTVLHGAKQNCGDFLIRDAAINFLTYHADMSRDSIHTVEVVRNKISEEEIKKIESTDAAFLAGGPGYRQKFYPEVYPALYKIFEVTTVVPLGPGWKGSNEDTYTFTQKSINILNKIAGQSRVPFLGARDLPSVRILRNHGLPAELTGCPGWYHYNGFPPNPTFPANPDVETILVSTPPQNNLQYLSQYIFLIRMLAAEFPDATITLVFHRGQQDRAFTPVIGRPWRSQTWKDNVSSVVYGIINQISQDEQFNRHDPSGSSEYAELYYNADLHVGYRVHAHIPSLSAGTPSFLLQIDGRGTGVSESLGTNADTFAGDGLRAPVQEIMKHITSNRRTEFSDFDVVGENIRTSYENMKRLVRESIQVSSPD
jgi:hypothetical protein